MLLEAFFKQLYNDIFNCSKFEYSKFEYERDIRSNEHDLGSSGNKARKKNLRSNFSNSRYKITSPLIERVQ